MTHELMSTGEPGAQHLLPLTLRLPRRPNQPSPAGASPPSIPSSRLSLDPPASWPSPSTLPLGSPSCCGSPLEATPSPAMPAPASQSAGVCFPLLCHPRAACQRARVCLGIARLQAGERWLPWLTEATSRRAAWVFLIPQLTKAATLRLSGSHQSPCPAQPQLAMPCCNHSGPPRQPARHLLGAVAQPARRLVAAHAHLASPCSWLAAPCGPCLPPACCPAWGARPSAHSCSPCPCPCPRPAQRRAQRRAAEGAVSEARHAQQRSSSTQEDDNHSTRIRLADPSRLLVPQNKRASSPSSASWRQTAPGRAWQGRRGAWRPQT